MQILLESLLLLCFLACLVLAASSALDTGRRRLGRPRLGPGYWVALLGGAVLLAPILVFLFILAYLKLAVSIALEAGRRRRERCRPRRGR